MLVLCGDHGMSEAGGHGASSMEELNTALILISSAFERKPGEDLGMFTILKLYSVYLSGNCVSLKYPKQCEDENGAKGSQYLEFTFLAPIFKI